MVRGVGSFLGYLSGHLQGRRAGFQGSGTCVRTADMYRDAWEDATSDWILKRGFYRVPCSSVGSQVRVYLLEPCRDSGQELGS